MPIEPGHHNQIFWHRLRVSKEERSRIKSQKAVVIWLTGLPGSGKTTISGELEKRLHEMKAHTYVIDGDNLRHGLNKDLGFSKKDRYENLRRAGELAKLFVDAGLIVICAFVSPYRSDRRMVREMLLRDEFITVFVKCPIEECIRRVPKGLYQKALAGKIAGVTGIDDPYEEPEDAEITVETDKMNVDVCVETILAFLREKNSFPFNSCRLSCVDVSNIGTETTDEKISQSTNS